MRLLSWNCQGLGADLTGKTLKRLRKRYSPSMLFIMETRQQNAILTNWKVQLKYNHCHFVNPTGQSSGGLALFWDDTVSVSSITSSSNFICTSVKFLAEDFSCNITWMYGNPHVNEKNSFWRYAYSAFPPCPITWLCIGDFNEILWLHEKWGGLTQPNW